ncbi:MAG: pyrroline-5-carboxylate reductase [Marinilabiliaceae bacterium]|nr:pyrroline-5-carboxylate reductase [Marinilabiliaceae bacterium]
MKNLKITIIGGGNLGSAISRGLVNSKAIDPSQLTVSDNQLKQLEALKLLGVNVTNDNKSAVVNADIVMLAVKPWFVETVMIDIANSLDVDKTIFITLAAGVSSKTIQELSGNSITVFAVMPNTAIAVGESMTCVSSRNASKEQEQLVLSLFGSMGKAILISESSMGAATALASCGTAYALRYIHAAAQAGIEIGFNAEVATQIVAQVVKGASEIILKNGSHPEVEIDKVTTPGGITINGLNAMEHAGFSSSVISGVVSSFNKVNKGK